MNRIVAAIIIWLSFIVIVAWVTPAQALSVHSLNYDIRYLSQDFDSLEANTNYKLRALTKQIDRMSKTIDRLNDKLYSKDRILHHRVDNVEIPLVPVKRRSTNIKINKKPKPVTIADIMREDIWNIQVEPGY